jgi:hypothetical protein
MSFNQTFRHSAETLAITPLYTKGKLLFVQDVQDHLTKGNMPGAALAYEEIWRPRQPWEDQPRLGVVEEISMSSPAVTSTPDGYPVQAQPTWQSGPGMRLVAVNDGIFMVAGAASWNAEDGVGTQGRDQGGASWPR